MVDFGINIAFLQTLNFLKYWYWFCICFLQALNIVKYRFCTSINNCQILILILYSLCTSSEKLSNISCVGKGKINLPIFPTFPRILFPSDLILSLFSKQKITYFERITLSCFFKRLYVLFSKAEMYCLVHFPHSKENSFLSDLILRPLHANISQLHH